LSDLSVQVKTTLIVDYAQAYRQIAELQRNLNSQSVNMNLGANSINTAPIVQGTNAINQQAAAINNASSGLGGYQASIQQTGLAFNNMSNTAVSAMDAMASTMAAQMILRILGQIKEAFEKCVKAAVEFETNLANVRKTTSFSVSQMAELKSEIEALAQQIPLTTAEFAKIAEIGGQLNIPQDRIIQFTKIMADLGATTAMSSDEAADFVARFSNITQMPLENWDRFSSALVELGNNFAGSESEIGAMALRLASAGQAAGISEAAVLGLSAALNAVGLRADAAGSSFSKVLNRINIAVNTANSELEDFARVAGMSAQQFSEAFNSNAANALVSFIEGLADVERHGKNTIVLMDELGLTEVRLSDALRRAAGSGELFREAIAISNKAFDENVALQNEAAIRYETTESQLKLLSNAVNQFKVSVGDALTPAIGSIASGLAKAVSGIAEFLAQNKWIVQTVTPVIAVFGGMAAAVASFTLAMKSIKFLGLDKFFANFTSLGKPKYRVSGFIAARIIGARVFVCRFANACTCGLVSYFQPIFRLAREANWCVA